MNLPNQLTASRFVLAIVLFVLIELDLWLACLFVFIVAAFTDWLDGYLARRWKLQSTLGRNLDPLVDKVLVCGAYIFLLEEAAQRGGWLQPWMVVIIVSRELIITGLRSYLEGLGAQFGADWLGKIKMVLQCAALIAIFVALEARDRKADSAETLGLIRTGLVWAMLIATAWSGLQYLWKAATILKR
jgi:CDP-diacylglycerol--glycerol-3-phosphate 3-phosphatidyltransferase